MPALTERSAVDLAAAIRRRELTSLQIVEAHVERLRATHGRLNAVVADCYESALSQARSCDQRIAQRALRGEANDQLPPLFGVPFTVKESIALQGMPQTAGVPSRRGVVAQQTAPAVAQVLEAGAIPLGVTNVSELTLWIESENPLYGRTNNPYDSLRSAGGSSGGEAAAVGIGGSPFGIAADIGGSIRTPAMFCGVFGHKPGSELVSSVGVWPTVTGMAGQMLGTGLLTRRAEDLMPILRLMAGGQGAASLGDPDRVAVAGLQVTTIADATENEFAPSLRDARERAVAALVSAGAQRRTVTIPGWRDTLFAYLLMLQEDHASRRQPTRALLREAGDQLGLLGQVFRSEHTLPTRITLAAEQLGRLTPAATRTKLMAKGRAVVEQLTDAIGDGVLLHPAHPTTAPLHRRTYGRPWLMMPAAIFNMADVPVTEVPLGLSPEGLPVGIQVAAAKGADRVSIAVARVLEDALGGWVSPRTVGASRDVTGPPVP